MDSAAHWNQGGYHSGRADAAFGLPPMIEVPELDIPTLNIAAAAPSSQNRTARLEDASAPQLLTSDQIDMLSMSGTITLPPGIHVGPQGVRDMQYSHFGAQELQISTGAAPAVQLSQQELDYLSSTGTITLQPGLRVGTLGVRGPAGQAGPGRNGAALPEVLSLRELEIIKQLGAGASARVHLASHPQTGKYYALKDIQVSLDARARRELGTEIQISRTVESDHVVKCYNAFYEEGHMTLVLEFMDGGSVADLLAQVGRIAEFYLADIARQALEGFRDLHGHSPTPIIHRDIKPSNLLINRAGQLKISDFGVSRILEDSNDVGRTFAGTYTYMSPERITGGEYRTDSDIWALGLSLLECATGEYPYQPAMDYFTLLNAVKNRPPPEAPPNEFSPEFCDFIKCCLQKEPERRWSAEMLLGHQFCRKYEFTRLVDLLNTIS